MTKPKETARDRFRKLPKWQQLSTKIVIVGLVIGAIVGIAVGISIKVHGGVYQSTNQQAAIPT
jgi:ABC-type nitrate/sulfonate/bicarbonate transport system permease component